MWVPLPVYLPAARSLSGDQGFKAKVNNSECRFREKKLAFGYELFEFFLESLILAQDERWRRA